MIRYIYADELDRFPLLADTMFRDRATQFGARLNWDVRIDENGHERDQYDDEFPLYVIWQQRDGTHGGSMRILPTTGRTMINDHFRHLTDGVEIASPLIWECTRFCISPRLKGGFRAAMPVSAALMLAGCELGVRFGLTHAVGVFDARMIRIYRALGWTPEILGSEGEGAAAISAGLWPIDTEARATISRKSGIAEALAAEWYELSFPSRISAEGQILAAE
ncbi:MAG: autoinducer synthase [Alphaproteobacteria bacterium]|nr:MAG: autoinducer synthase [Alphaproteobacteria bacterium]